jgi:sugar phosphate isomerase/epimerase
MQLGYVSAILPDQSLPEVMQTARAIGYDCVEIMCWPTGGSERRYAGVTHIDVDTLDDRRVAEIHQLVADTGVGISGLGYYPNPLSPNEEEARVAREHFRKVMMAAQRLGIGQVNTFIGRHPKQMIDEQWPTVLEVWKPLVKEAEDRGLRIGIENCPMLFSKDEWPGGKNIFTCPQVWRRLFHDIPSASLGMNYDPSHLIWTFIDPVPPIYEFKDKMFHVHAKDARVDRDRLQEVGVMNLDWHTPKLPGMGDCDWGAFFGALTDIKYVGPVCVEVEDRAFEGSLEDRKRSLVQSYRYLSQYVVKA